MKQKGGGKTRPQPCFLALTLSLYNLSIRETHARTYTQYASFRRGFSGDENDTRCVWFGLDWWLEKYLEPGWDPAKDVDAAAAFFSTHLAPACGSYPFPKEILLAALRETGGHFPVTIRALPAGTVVHPGVPLFTMTAKRLRRKTSEEKGEEEEDDGASGGGGVPSLVTWLESLLTHSWYPSSVATLSRRARDAIESAFERSCDSGKRSPLVPSRLHDFGLRGATGVEAAVLGGAAHLLSFEGSDTVPACFAAQFGCNAGRPVASSIPATEQKKKKKRARKTTAAAAAAEAAAAAFSSSGQTPGTPSTPSSRASRPPRSTLAATSTRRGSGSSGAPA